MQLIGYQSDYFEKLYSSIVNDERQLISFTGPRGCGKSTIIDEIADYLKETWKIFMLSGTGKSSPPYYTWYAASHTPQMYIKKNVSNISFAVNFQPIGLPIGLEAGVSFAKEQYIFNDNEQAILKAINCEINADNVLFLAEDYNSWDQASKNLLLMILAYKSSIFKNKNIHIILIDSSIDDSSTLLQTTNDKLLKIQIDNIELEDIVQIVNQQPNIKALHVHDLESIVSFTGYDLRLINLAVQYKQKNIDNIEIHSLKELLDKRFSHMSEDYKAMYKILESVSIIKSFFTEKETAYLLKKEPIYAEKILDEAVNLRLIRKRHSYDFPNLEIKKYFEERLDIEKKYLHHRFSQYLQIYYPEDYFNRAHHLFFSEEANDNQNTINAIYFLAIEITRRKEITGGTKENILEKQLDVFFEKLPSSIKNYIHSNITAYFKGNLMLVQCSFHEAITQFAGMHHMYASKAFSVEVMRLHLLSHIQLADDLDEIKKLSDEIYDYMNDTEFNEDDIWCRTALILLEVYGDRHVHVDKFNKLKSGFDSRIRKHIYQSNFRALHAKYACKSSLFYNSLIAVKLTEESCDYFRTYNSTINLYFSLCNNAANRIVCGEYVKAEVQLNECKKIITENINIKFPSTYKIENNIIINTFLQSEGSSLDYSSRIKEIIISSAVEAANKLELLRDQQGYEVSHIIEFNLLSMYMLCGKDKNATYLFYKFETEYRYLDVFYKYYYHSMCCAKNILISNYSNAIEHLKILETLHVVLLSSYSKILNRRNLILHELISDKFIGEAFSFNYEFVKRGIRIQDPSASFWGRGFLLSDLQFLSL
jgi:energy-coupling factor transporter ATP-binding protein EcfA2